MPAKILNMPGKVRILWIREGGAIGTDPPFPGESGPFSVEFAPSVEEGLRHLQDRGADALLADFPLACHSPAELLEKVQRLGAYLPVLIHDPNGTMADAVRLAKLGADQVFAGPLETADLRLRFHSALEGRSASTLSSPWKQFLVGESRAMAEVERMIRLVGPRRSTVLVHGETGTGKEMAARAIHLASPRASRPLVAVNCSALPESLLEAELFGHVKGAFTGAVQLRTGRFEQANGSTLFLDEIGDMPLELQAKLLRVLQEREFQRLGSSETQRVDVRVIAASNVDLEERVRQRTFREDLYYRLNVVPIRMPALRERLSDIPTLVAHFIAKICSLEQFPLKRVCPDALDRLTCYWWPGNVRQLENAVEMAVVLSGERTLLSPADFPLPAEIEDRIPPAPSAPTIPVPDSGLDFERTVSHFERSILEQALRKTGGNKKMAAAMLRLKRTTLSAKLRSLEAAG